MTKPMPRWLHQLLLQAGHLTGDGATRAARARYCRSCGQPTIAGLDHERAALTARCDPQPLNATGEYHALLAGRDTYALTWRYSRYELDLRGLEQVQRRPAGDPANTFDVLAQHDCGHAATSDEQAASNITTPSHPGEQLACPY